MHSRPKGIPSSVIGAPCHDRPRKKQEIAPSLESQQSLGRVKRETGGLCENRPVKEKHRRGAELGPFREHQVAVDGSLGWYCGRAVDAYEMEGAEAGPQEPGNHGNRDVHRPVKRSSEISAKVYSDQACVCLEKRKEGFFFFFF